MVGYQKGTDVEQEFARIRESVARIGAAMQSDPDEIRAFGHATELEKLGSEISMGAGRFRSWFAAQLVDERRIPLKRLAGILGISATSGRLNKLVSAGRQQRRGNPIVDPGTTPELAPVALAVVTCPSGVLVAHRRDGRPPWTFPGGEMLPGEAPAEVAARRCREETGIEIKTLTVLGRRVHPRTGRTMVYMAAQPADETATPLVPADDPDLDNTEYIGIDEVRARMPDMFPPVQAHLEGVLVGFGVY